MIYGAIKRFVYLWINPECDDELFYVGGQEVLPAPLKVQEEQNCLLALN